MFNCKIYQELGESSLTIFDRDFKSLREIAKELVLSYQQVADLSSRITRPKYQQFKFYPKIDITRIYNY